MESEVMERLSRVIQGERIKTGISQEELGDELGVKRQAVSDMENGHRDSFDYTRMRRLADVLGYESTDDLYEEALSLAERDGCGRE